MPYTHYHNFSFHTHRQRRRYGRHHREISCRQRPWRILFTVALLACLVYGLFHSGIADNAVDIFQSLGPTEAEKQAKAELKAAEEAEARDREEREIGALINIEREKKGYHVLSWDQALQDLARSHSSDMAKNNYLEHDNFKGQNPNDRATAAGYFCIGPLHIGVAENVKGGGKTYHCGGEKVYHRGNA